MTLFTEPGAAVAGISCCFSRCISTCLVDPITLIRLWLEWTCFEGRTTTTHQPNRHIKRTGIW